MTDTTLLPCPFCGGEEIFIEPDERGSGGQHVAPYHVGCKACNAEQMAETEDEAIAAWNCRPSPSVHRQASAGQEGVTVEQIERIATVAHAEGRLPWVGFKTDANGFYTVPVISGSNTALVRAVLRALSTAAPESGWPIASKNESASGWTLDYKFLERVTSLAASRTEYTTSLEATEQILIAAREVGAAAPTAGETL